MYPRRLTSVQRAVTERTEVILRRNKEVKQSFFLCTPPCQDATVLLGSIPLQDGGNRGDSSKERHKIDPGARKPNKRFLLKGMSDSSLHVGDFSVTHPKAQCLEVKVRHLNLNIRDSLLAEKVIKHLSSLPGEARDSASQGIFQEGESSFVKACHKTPSGKQKNRIKI